MTDTPTGSLHRILWNTPEEQATVSKAFADLKEKLVEFLEEIDGVANALDDSANMKEIVGMCPGSLSARARAQAAQCTRASVPIVYAVLLSSGTVCHRRAGQCRHVRIEPFSCTACTISIWTAGALGGYTQCGRVADLDSSSILARNRVDRSLARVALHDANFISLLGDENVGIETKRSQSVYYAEGWPFEPPPLAPRHQGRPVRMVHNPPVDGGVPLNQQAEAFAERIVRHRQRLQGRPRSVLQGVHVV